MSVLNREEMWPWLDEVVTTYVEMMKRTPGAWESFRTQIDGRRHNMNKFGEVKGQSQIVKDAELRVKLAFPAFYDNHGEYQEITPVLKQTFKRFGYPDFPTAKTGDAKSKRAFDEFFRRYHKLFGVADEL